MADELLSGWEPRWRRWSADTPQAVALADAQRQISYGELPGAVDDLAARLSGAGVARGARVLVVSENNVATLVALYALRRLGAWPAPFNARAGGAELEALVALAQPSHLLYAPELAPAVAPLMSGQRLRSRRAPPGCPRRSCGPRPRCCGWARS
jgi:acyl-CoA synthetase (AMP-forming)/AMP-acid ligase II